MSLSDLRDQCASTYTAHRHNVDIDFPGLSKEDADANAFSMTAVDVFHSSSANDIRNRNEFQKGLTLTTEFNGMNIEEHRANKAKNKKRKKNSDIYNSNAERPLGFDPDSISPVPTNTLNYDMGRSSGGRGYRNGLEPLVPTPMTGESRSVSIQNDAGFALLKEMESGHLFFATDTISPKSMGSISLGIGRIRKGTTEGMDEAVLNCANAYADQGKSAKELLPMVYSLYKSTNL